MKKQVLILVSVFLMLSFSGLSLAQKLRSNTYNISEVNFQEIPSAGLRAPASVGPGIAKKVVASGEATTDGDEESLSSRTLSY